MTKPIRFASTASLVALASIIAGCATPHSGFREVKQVGEVGLATRAMAALNANDPATAIELAERAVEKTPNDAGFRSLLGNAYFAGGRFASAESAYKDSLAMYSNQPKVVLKLVLVQIAQGKNAEAMSFLDAARSELDSADYGLALALGGRLPEAIDVLETAARVPNANGRVRQNLALAYAFSGDWTTARTIASQDVPADQLDARIQQWMQLARPAKASDQVAALTGVTPSAADPGQPVQLAFIKPQTQLAQATPAAPAPQAPIEVQAQVPIQPEAQPQPEFAAAPLPPPPPPVYEAPPSAPAPAVAQADEPASVSVAMAAAAAPEAPAAFAALAPKVAAKAPAKPAVVRKASAPVRKRNVLQRGNSTAVVQLGAYKSPEYVMAAWGTLTKRYPALRDYLPMRARFDSPKGTFWRLSIQGFDSQREAIERCQLLKSRGGTCFVRNIAGDAPVQIASR